MIDEHYDLLDKSFLKSKISSAQLFMFKDFKMETYNDI